MTTKVTTFRVTAPYVAVKVHTGPLIPSARANGVTVLGYYENAVLPGNADPADVARLLAKGVIEEVPGDA